MRPPPERNRRCRGVRSGVVIADESAAQRGAHRPGEHRQHDVEVDVERHGAGEGVEVE
jgi:hypothetical protein